MDKTYDPSAIEQRWYRTWEEAGHFSPTGEGAPYCIMIPPPNVTGTLHMGHAFQDTIMDTLIRYHRMQGHNTLWQPGTDHAGIATQMVVERQLAAQGESRHDLGREAFVERVWAWKETSGGSITRQLRRMGASLDWSRERFTMDPGLSRAVSEVFVQLYDEGLIYRGKRLVNWDPVLHTAISDLEVISEEEQGHLWHMRYPLADGSGHLVVATTRPETLLGDTAVAVNPDDERYRQLVGKTVMLPLAEREIPIIADDYVDPEFGTGCVKITPAHDFNDYAVGERHGLPMINIFTVDARLNDEVPEAYRSLDRYDARKKVVDDLQALGLLERIDDHKLMVPRGDRSGAVVEPYLTDQWFVDLTREAQPDGRPGGHAALTEPALEVVRSGAIKFVPGNWDKTYYNWLENIEDWCISRQIWWGHRIPAWYDESGRVYVARDETEAREKYGLDAGVALTQDADVLDTWFSSALWPFSTLGWPDKTRELATFYPTSVLVTGFDIIFFWVARMIMMGVKFMGDVPFREVYVHGLVRDGEGQKMSKSKGNVIDPIDAIDGIDLEALVEKRTREVMQPHLRTRIEKMTRRNLPDGIPSYGTDALRFTFASLATTGRDIKLNPNQIEGYRNFCNKLWNATRYVLMQTEGEDTGLSGSVEPSLADRWIEALLAQTAAQVNTQLRAYRFDLAAKALYEFTWHEYCDWYLELSKPVLASETASPAAKRGTRRTLVRVLEQLLRLLHPFMPYITEELWQGLRPLAGREGDTIQHQAFPAGDEAAMDPQVAAEIEWTKAFILGMRRIRAEMDIAPGKPLPLLLKGWTDEDRGRFERSEAFIGFLARPERVDWLSEDDATPECATALVGDMQLLIPLAGLIDVEAEVARLEREIGKLGKGLERGEAKLAQPSFVERAPAAVVEKERQRVDEMRAAMAQLQAQLEKIRSL